VLIAGIYDSSQSGVLLKDPADAPPRVIEEDKIEPDPVLLVSFRVGPLLGERETEAEDPNAITGGKDVPRGGSGQV